MKEGKVVQVEKLRKFCCEALMAAGIPAPDAPIIADSFAEADLIGREAHGISLLLRCVQSLRDGTINPRPDMKIVKETSCTAVLDGDDGMGALAAIKGMELAIKKARDFSVGVVGVRRGETVGALFYYPAMAIKHGMIGLITTNGSPIVPPYGGKTRLLNTNPWAFAIPAGEELPIILDMAVTSVANLKIGLAAKKGEKIPLDWALDPEGVPTDDPTKAGFAQWMGGPKGYGMAVVTDVLAGILTGGPLKPWVTTLKGLSGKFIRRGHFILALNISSFMPLDEFTGKVDQMIRDLKSSERIKGVKEILLPGERGMRTREERLKSGIPISAPVWDEVEKLAGELNISSDMQ